MRQRELIHPSSHIPQKVDLIKRIINWNYERASWQWDILCIVCMMFIFLTPKAWFEKREATQTSRLIVKADGFSTEKSELENKVRELSGNPNAQIIELKERKDKQGNLFYEIDIR